MRITVVFDSPTRLADSSIRYERYLRGFRELGHQANLLTTAASAAGIDWADTVADRRKLCDPTLWSRLRPDVVVVPTWLGLADLLAVIRPHTPRLIALADSDGYVGARAHPRRVLRRMRAFHRTPWDRLRATGWWVRQFTGLDLSVERGMLASCRLCDRVVVFSPGARVNLQHFFRRAGADELTGRVAVAAYPVDESFASAPLSQERENRLVAIGRWEDPQKGVTLLVRGVREYLRRGGAWRVELIGSGGGEVFHRLLAEHPDRVEDHGVLPQKEVFSLLDRSRVLLSTSLWESGPIVASEALLRGCSLVGPSHIPSFRQFVDAGCGSLIRADTPSGVADALAEEESMWACGRRVAEELAARWRDDFTPRSVCKRLLADES